MLLLVSTAYSILARYPYKFVFHPHVKIKSLTIYTFIISLQMLMNVSFLDKKYVRMASV